MKKTFSQQKRKQLVKKLMENLKSDMKNLPKDLQQTLADDLVTAFQNRLTVFHRIKSKRAY